MFGAELFTQTAAAAAGTMVGLMTTDAWQAARQRIARILRREDVERLERARAELDAAPPGRQQVILREQRDDLDTTLRALLTRDPALSGLLSEFVQEFSGFARPVFIQVQQPPAPVEPVRAPGALTVAPPLGGSTAGCVAVSRSWTRSNSWWASRRRVCGCCTAWAGAGRRRSPWRSPPTPPR